MTNEFPNFTSMEITPGDRPGQSQIHVTLVSDADGSPISISATLVVRDVSTLTVLQIQSQLLAALALAVTPHAVPQ